MRSSHIYLAAHDIACIAGMCYLVVHDSPWWAGALLFSLLATTVGSEK